MLLLQIEIYQNIYNNMLIMNIIFFYIIGCIFAILVYNIIIYERYNNKLFKGYTKRDIISGTFILFSWFYFLTCIIKFKKIILRV